MVKSTKHRVVQPPPNPEEMEDADDPNAIFPARYSVSLSIDVLVRMLSFDLGAILLQPKHGQAH